ncbi:AEC family transporter [Frateuria aurantia]
MSALLLLLACLVLGALVSRFARPPVGIVPALNWWVVNIALPALVLQLLPQVHFDPQLWFLPALMWLELLGAWLVMSLLGRAMGWSRGRVGALILVGGIGNTSFMGYPMLEALRGREGLSLGVVADQVGSFAALATLGIVIASLYAGKQVTMRQLMRRVMSFPPFLALLLAVPVGLAGGWPPIIDSMLHAVGSTLTPLALFSVGMQLQLRPQRHELLPAFLGLSWKMLLAPLAGLLLAQWLGIHGPVRVAGVLQAAMAPMITAAIIADQYGLEPPLANTMLGAGILLSLATIPLWNMALG